MFTVEEATIESILQEMSQDGQDIVNTTMLLSALLQCKEFLAPQYSTETQTTAITRLLTMLEECAKELYDLSKCACRRLKSVEDTL